MDKRQSRADSPCPLGRDSARDQPGGGPAPPQGSEHTVCLGSHPFSLHWRTSYALLPGNHRIIILNRGKYQSVGFPRDVMSRVGSRYIISSQEHQVGPRAGPSEATVSGSMGLTLSGCLLVNWQPGQQLQTARFAGEERGPERLGSPSREQWGWDQVQDASAPWAAGGCTEGLHASGLRTGSHMSGPQDTISAAVPRT